MGTHVWAMKLQEAWELKWRILIGKCMSWLGDGSYSDDGARAHYFYSGRLQVDRNVLLDNNGYASIGGLSEYVGSQRFGTQYQFRSNGQLKGGPLPVDLAANARSLGAHVIECDTDRFC